ncbi:MAG TPA: penicillin-binding protein 2 [bacterium]|nr:penicillin-binding protein 2 [bacterium]
MADRGGPSVTPIKVASFLAMGLFLALALRLFYIQIIKGAHYVDLSNRNYIVQVALKAPRGDIVDRDGTVVAGSRQSFSICGIPRLLLRSKDEIGYLAGILGIASDDIVSELRPSARSFRPTAIAHDVDFATVSQVEEDFADIPDVMVVAEPVRSYPAAAEFAHLVGYVGEVTQQELDEARGAYAPGDLVGRAGVEKIYEPYLAGQDGVKFMRFSVAGGSGPADVAELPSRSPQRGMRAVLYADAGLQGLAETLLVGCRGAVVMLDVKTGGVLVLASSPSYDPSLFAAGISGADWEALVGSEDKPLLNRAIQCAYPPGSTYKIVTAGAALEGHVIDENTCFRPCYGYYKFGNRTFACWKKDGHGTLNLLQAITVSCDVYFYQLGEVLGIDQFASSSEKWHLDELTGIDLPGEVKGLVPNRAYYDSKFGKGKWSKGLMINLAIGQGEMLMTPIEMATFVAGLANGGQYYPPACVARVEYDGGAFVPDRKQMTLPMSQSTLDVLRRSMLSVCESPEGTGHGARVEGIHVAGKTGTAQNPHGDDHAWFVCFAPYEDPQVAICVMIENGGHGGTVGAPIARQLIEHYYHLNEPASPDSTADSPRKVAFGR